VVTTIELSGYIEDLLEALVRAGLYSSKTEAIREAVRRLVESYDLKELSLRAFKNGGISFQLAVDIGGISMDELIWFFLSHDTPPQLGADSDEEVNEGVKALRDKGLVVLDLSSLYVMLELNLFSYLPKLNKRFVVPDKVQERAQALLLRFSKMRGLIVVMDGVEVMRVNKSLAEFSRKNGISLQESHAIYLAKKMNGVLLSDDKRTRQVAKVHGVPAAPSVSLLVLGRDIGVLDEQTFRSLLGRLGSIPLQIPRTLLG